MRLFLKTLLIILFSVTSLGWLGQGGVAGKNREGNNLFSEGKIDEALSKWRDAQIKSPDKKELHYNIGNALHEQKKYEDAFNEYEKSLDSKDSGLRAKTYYNIGNTHYRMGRLPEAIEDYERCLDIDPDDEDAKYNIEFIRKKMKEDSQKERSEPKETKQDQGRKKQEEQREETKEGKEMSEDRDRDAPFDKKRDAEKGDMSKEDAIRILDALRDDEKDIQKELRTHPAEGRYRVDKDW